MIFENFFNHNQPGIRVSWFPPDIRREFALAICPTEFKSVRVQRLVLDLLPQQVTVSPFIRTRTTTTDRQTSFLAGSDGHVLCVFRAAYPRVRCHHIPHPRGTLAWITMSRSGNLWRTRRNFPWGLSSWVRNLWRGRSRQESSFPFKRSAQCYYCPQWEEEEVVITMRWRAQVKLESRCAIMTTRTWLTKQTGELRTFISHVNVHVLCVEGVLGLGNLVVIGVVSLHHAYAIPSTDFFLSGCCNSCCTQTLHSVIVNFICSHYRENGSLEVMSLHDQSSSRQISDSWFLNSLQFFHLMKTFYMSFTIFPRVVDLVEVVRHLQEHDQCLFAEIR